VPRGWFVWLAICVAAWWVEPLLGYFLAAAIAFTFIQDWRRKRHLARAISGRAPMPFDAFTHVLGPKDVRDDIALFVWTELQEYLKNYDKTSDFPLHPDDDLLKGLIFDPDDIYMDLSENIIDHFNLEGSDKTCRANAFYAPETLTPRALINFYSTLPEVDQQ
jgi:hypothetical protein